MDSLWKCLSTVQGCGGCVERPFPRVRLGKEAENRDREGAGAGIKCPEKRGQNTSDPKVLSKFFILSFSLFFCLFNPLLITLLDNCFYNIFL